MNKNKRKFDDVGEQVSHRGHWYSSGLHGHWNSESQNSTRFSGRLGGGIHRNNYGGGGVRGVMVQTPTPPPTKTYRRFWAEDRTVAKEGGRRRWNYGLGDGETSLRSAIGNHRGRWGQPSEPICHSHLHGHSCSHHHIRPHGHSPPYGHSCPQSKVPHRT